MFVTAFETGLSTATTMTKRQGRLIWLVFSDMKQAHQFVI
jgi:hypothetical protein